MNGMSASRAEAQPASDTTPILVWDAPVRVFHWLMVACFATAYLTAETERWRLLHVTLGTTMAGLVVFRLLWGLLGTRHARFASFVLGPAAAMRAIIRCVDAARDLPLAAGMEVEADAVLDLFETADAIEGISAFLDKRAPTFSKRHPDQ